MRSVLVTGAAGFIGGHVVESFLKSGWRVFALVHRRRSARLERLADRIGILEGDVAEPDSVRAVLAACCQAGEGPPVVAHCAGRASDVGRDREFRRANYESVVHLGEAVLRGEAERLVFVSTTDVYGILDHTGTDEDSTPLRAVPDNPYPRYKIQAEDWLRAHVPPERWTIIRPAAVWGEDDPTMSARVVSFLRISPVIVHFGPWRGRNRWPLAHVRNVAETVRLGAERPESRGLAINVLDSEWTSVDEFYRLLARAYFPGRRYGTLSLPRWLGWPFAATVSGISNLLNLSHPFTDPSRYALEVVSRNLDFANGRWLALMRQAGVEPVTREQGIAELTAGSRT
jgi:nucleoside-diphosphate-sugar epimerase